MAHGESPLTFTAISNGNYYIHWNTDFACGQATGCGTTTIAHSQVVTPPVCYDMNGSTGVLLTEVAETPGILVRHRPHQVALVLREQMLTEVQVFISRRPLVD